MWNREKQWNKVQVRVRQLLWNKFPDIMIDEQWVEMESWVTGHMEFCFIFFYGYKWRLSAHPPPILCP